MQHKTIKRLSIALFIMLLLWGGYTLITYLGVPYHGIVLLDRTVFDSLQNVCGPTDHFCRGFHSFWPYLERTFKRIFLWYADGQAHGTAFLWYVVISVGLYVCYIGWSAFRTGRIAFKWKFKPWHILVCFIASVWLFFTLLSTVQPGKDKFPRQLVEASPQVYKNIGPEALETLKTNMKQLEERNCLSLKGQFQNGARVYDLKIRCIQQSFITRVLSVMAIILLLLFEMLIMGRAVVRWLRLKPDSLLLESILSVGFGACAFIAILWTIAVISVHAHLTLYNAAVGWGLLVAIPLIGFKHVRYWLKQFTSYSWEVEHKAWDPVVLLKWLLISYLAFNFLSVVRPFPIGWDDLGSYLNRPRLMVSYGHFIFSMAPFFWEYITSLGFLLFGYTSHFGATVSMMVNWSAGLIATLSVLVFTSVFLGKGRGVLAALLYYTLPMVGHFSFADMKIDNAVFFMGVLSTLCVFIYLFGQSKSEEATEEHSGMSLWWLVAAGIFGGFAFAIKPTAIMVLIPLGAIILAIRLHWSSFIAMLFVAVAVFMWQGLNVERMIERLFGGGANVSKDLLLLVFAFIGLTSLGIIAYKNKRKFKSATTAVAVFAISFVVSMAPWLAHNNYLRGNVIPGFVFKAPNNISPILDYDRTRLHLAEEKNLTVRSLPEELVIDREHPLCKPTGGKEELDRYWGFEQGWGHYLTLPWRTVMNIDSTGYYVTTIPLLLLMPLLLLLPFFWIKRARWMRWLFWGTLFMIFEWAFLANGIIWYGLGMFLGFVVLLEALVAKAPDKLNRVAISTLVGFSLIIVLALRMWQFETQSNLFEYPMGKASAEVMIERTVPHYNDIADIVVQRSNDFPDRSYLYRMGTFIPYFIPRNLEIIGIQDHQLDYFNCLYQERDAKLTLERVKALGFNSIIFDTNTATIERDPNGSLHQKVNMFIDWVNNPELGLNIVISDTKAGVAFVLLP